MKKAYDFLGILCWCMVGGFIGRTLHIIREHNEQGDKLKELAKEMGVADNWVQDIIISGAITAGIIAVCIIARIIIKKKYGESFSADNKDNNSKE